MGQKWRFEGRPTGPDVQKLKEHYSRLSIGDIIEFSKAAEIIGEKEFNTRARTVMESFRKATWREKNMFFIAIPTVGLQVADNSKRVSSGASIFASGLKRQSRAGSLMQRTASDGLTESEIRIRDNTIRIAGSIKVLAATETAKLKWQPPEIKNVQ